VLTVFSPCSTRSSTAFLLDGFGVRIAKPNLNFVTNPITIFWEALGDHGFLKHLGAIDIGGSGAVHLVGGASG